MIDPIQEQLEAFNSRDLERFLNCYASDVVVANGEGKRLFKGHGAMREVYGPLFADHPNLHCAVQNQICAGPYTVQEQLTTGAGDQPERGITIYRVQHDKIVLVRFLE